MGTVLQNRPHLLSLSDGLEDESEDESDHEDGHEGSDGVIGVRHGDDSESDDVDSGAHHEPHA